MTSHLARQISAADLIRSLFFQARLSDRITSSLLFISRLLRVRCIELGMALSIGVRRSSCQVTRLLPWLESSRISLIVVLIESHFASRSSIVDRAEDRGKLVGAELAKHLLLLLHVLPVFNQGVLLLLLLLGEQVLSDIT